MGYKPCGACVLKYPTAISPARRNATGPREQAQDDEDPATRRLHEKLADLLLIRSGEGTVLVGGKMVDGKPSGLDEVRGKSIDGGTKYPIAAGDTLYIPANTPHQFLVEPGKGFTAMVVKITPKP